MSREIKKKQGGVLNERGIIRIGVISDTHINNFADELPRAVLDDLKIMDAIIHAGDLVSLSLLEQLKKLSGCVIAVCGNMDQQEVRDILPEKEIIIAGRFKIGLMHGYGPPPALIEAAAQVFKHEAVQAVIFGHSHSPVNETRNGILYFNPGSVTDKIFSPFNSYGIIEVGESITAKIIRI
jgi:uncharacterized protein